MRNVLSVSLILLAANFAINVADADTMTFDSVFNAEPPEFFFLDHPGFDPSMGTLEMVTFELSGSGFIDGVVFDDDGSGDGFVLGTIVGDFAVPELSIFGPVDFTGKRAIDISPGASSPIQVLVKGAGTVAITDPEQLAGFVAAIPGDTQSIELAFDFPMYDGGPDEAFAMSSDLAADFSVTYTFSALVLGDLNGDGEVNLLDVQPFVDALSKGTFIPEADINQDGAVDLLDVAPFVQLLI